MSARRPLRAYRPAQALMTRRIAAGNSKPEALRVLKRHLADVLYAAMCSADQASAPPWLDNQPQLGIGASHGALPRRAGPATVGMATHRAVGHAPSWAD